MRFHLLKKFVRHRAAFISSLLLTFISLTAVFAPWIAPYSYEEQNMEARLESPSLHHWMGTDPLGRDLYSRTIYGAQTSLLVGIATALFSLVLGTFTGAIAGYKGKWVDRLLMRIVDVFYIFPSLLLAILLMILCGRGLFGICFALGLTSWVTTARLVRGLVIQAKDLPYVESARALGRSEASILLKHILPNLLGSIVVSLSFQIPTNMMAESFLSFLGLGLQPPHSSWGTLAAEGFRAMKSYPHLIVGPGIVLFVTLLMFNYLGDGLRDLLDPKQT